MVWREGMCEWCGGRGCVSGRDVWMEGMCE